MINVRAAKPPTTPPTIGPVLFLLFVVLGLDTTLEDDWLENGMLVVGGLVTVGIVVGEEFEAVGVPVVDWETGLDAAMLLLFKTSF
jgi:hypothetical protein